MSDPLTATCPACGGALYRYVYSYTLGSLRCPGPSYRSIDRTWRHQDGTLACAEPEESTA